MSGWATCSAVGGRCRSRRRGQRSINNGSPARGPRHARMANGSSSEGLGSKVRWRPGACMGPRSRGEQSSDSSGVRIATGWPARSASLDFGHFAGQQFCCVPSVFEAGFARRAPIATSNAGIPMRIRYGRAGFAYITVTNGIHLQRDHRLAAHGCMRCSRLPRRCPPCSRPLRPAGAIAPRCCAP